MKGGEAMKDAGAIILAFGIIFTVAQYKLHLGIGAISGAAGPVMVVVGALMLCI